MTRIPVVERIMKANDDVAAANRQLLDDHGVHAEYHRAPAPERRA